MPILWQGDKIRPIIILQELELLLPDRGCFGRVEDLIFIQQRECPFINPVGVRRALIGTKYFLLKN